MGRLDGAHTHGPGRQRRRPGPGRIATAVLIGSGAAPAAASAIASALVTIIVILGCLTGLAFLGGIARLVYRARQDGRGRPIAAPGPCGRYPEARPRLEGFHISESDRGRELHIHLHGLTPQQIAAIVTQRGGTLRRTVARAAAISCGAATDPPEPQSRRRGRTRPE